MSNPAALTVWEHDAPELLLAVELALDDAWGVEIDITQRAGVPSVGLTLNPDKARELLAALDYALGQLAACELEA